MDEISEKPRLKFAKAEARRLLKDINIKDIPVSLVKVIKYLQGKYQLEIRKISGLDPTISGFLAKEVDIYDDEKYILGFNEEHSWYRNRFTIAHEIGHLVMGHSCSEHNSLYEKESDTFAAELLIPKDPLKKDFKISPQIPELSIKYCVSLQSMAIKVQTDRLI